MKVTRRIVQFGFLFLVIFGVFIYQGNAERWCPFGGVEALYTYAVEGNMLCSLGVSNFYILAGVLLVTLLLKRAFCGYMCPIGTISEWLGSLSTRLGLRPVQVPVGLDRFLSLLKYVMLGVVLFITYRAGELLFRGFDPCYALLSRHGEDITLWAYVVAGSIVVASLFIKIPFCRWFCPLAAVLNPFSRAAVTCVKRNEEACTGCGVCNKSCPMAIDIESRSSVKEARCISCLNCVVACNKTNTGALSWGPTRGAKGWSQAMLIAIMLACVSGAVAASYAIPMPSFVKTLEDRGPEPAQLAVLELEVTELSCRGRATLLGYFIDRDDLYAIPGYIKIEAWPGFDPARVRILYDPTATDEVTIKDAIIEPYYDQSDGRWDADPRMSPFEIVGYDPLGLDE